MFVGLSILFFIAAIVSILNDGDINKFIMLAGVSSAFAIASSLAMISSSIDRLLTGSIKYEHKNYIDGTSELKFKDKND